MFIITYYYFKSFDILGIFNIKLINIYIVIYFGLINIYCNDIGADIILFITWCLY